MWGFFFGLTAVIFGAFGAHALKEILSNEQLESFQTGVRYQMYHALLLILLSNLKEFQLKSILYLLVSGTFLFSFSIYLLSIRNLIDFKMIGILGPITPIGGTLLIASWALLLLRVIRSNSTNQS